MGASHFWMIKDNYFKNWNFLNVGHKSVEFSFPEKPKKISIFWLLKTVDAKVAISLSSKLKKENDRISYHLKFYLSFLLIFNVVRL